MKYIANLEKHLKLLEYVYESIKEISPEEYKEMKQKIKKIEDALNTTFIPIAYLIPETDEEKEILDKIQFYQQKINEYRGDEDE
jgi:hypothetical protein